MTSSLKFSRLHLWLAIARLLVLSETVAAQQVSCPNGSIVREERFCKYFYHFTAHDVQHDYHIPLRLGLGRDGIVRNVALVIGVSTYPQIPEANIPTAASDAVNFAEFLKSNQEFDEVVLLREGEATKDNINYFLHEYFLNRGESYIRRARFLLAYSGHGVETDANSAALVLSGARSTVVQDGNLYPLNLIKSAVQNLAPKYFHVLVLINACYGGNMFTVGALGGNPSDTFSPGAYAVTAGPKDQLVRAVGEPGKGSIFFENIIEGVRTGQADNATLVGESGSPFQQGDGVIRLGPLVSYLSAKIDLLNRAHGPGSDGKRAFAMPSIGAIGPDFQPSQGGFFFIGPWPRIGPAPPPIEVPLGPISSLPNRPEIKVFKNPHEYPIRGVDLSSLNETVEWESLRKNIQSIYLRATRAASFDPEFRTRWEQAEKVGLPRGAYHLYNFCQGPEQQFDRVRSIVPRSEDALPIAIAIELYDGEWPRGNQALCARKDTLVVRGELSRLLQLLEEHYRKRPIIYGTRDVFGKLVDKELSKYMVWLASYRNARDVRLAGRSPWTMWQYTDQAEIDGVSGRVDLNLFFGRQEEFERFKKGSGNVALDAVLRSN